MVGALVRRAVSEEADDHVRLLLHLEGQRSARRDGQVAADDGVGGHGADGDIAGVHGAALTLAAALGLAEHLAHNALDGHALGDVVTGGTVRRRHPVILAQIIQHTHGAGFLAGGLVNAAGHDPFQEQVVDALLVLADGVHLLVHAESLFFGGESAHFLTTSYFLYTSSAPGWRRRGLDYFRISSMGLPSACGRVWPMILANVGASSITRPRPSSTPSRMAGPLATNTGWGP